MIKVIVSKDDVEGLEHAVWVYMDSYWMTNVRFEIIPKLHFVVGFDNGRCNVVINIKVEPII